VWTDSEPTQPLCPPDEHDEIKPSSSRVSVPPTSSLPPSVGPLTSEHGWCIPSSLSLDPDPARARIFLPRFDESVLSQAQAIAECFPFADTEVRGLRDNERATEENETPRFEKVFRMAAAIANVPIDATRYDELLILTAWHCVRPQEEGFLGSYPKSLLCPLSHAATPGALNSLPPAKRMIFERRVPVYLRYLLCDKFGLRTCADVENADLRQLLRNTGFRLIRASAAPEVAFPGITRGDDPPVRPWKVLLRQELSDDRAADMLVRAAVWHIKHALQLVTMQQGKLQWNIGAFARMDWEDAFLSLGVRVAPSLTRESGLIDWRAVLGRCIDQIGSGNLPPDLLGKVLAVPQRVSHDNQQGIWSVLDRISDTVLEKVRVLEPGLFNESGRIDYRAARKFRRWARLFDEISPNILSRFGVSAFTALHRVAPESFGLGRHQLKPWELEQEHGKWKGPRGRALLKSAYAFALSEAGLGDVEYRNEEVVWQCTRTQFLKWSAARAEKEISAYDFLYRLASAHGLTPLLNREITHTAAISLLAGMNLHENLPRIEGCWDVCMRTALERHGGKLEVRLSLPDLVPLPLRLRKAVLAPLKYNYLHKELRLVRDFDRRMARESHRKLEEIPGWWEDERIVGTPLAQRISDPADPVRPVLGALNTEPWLDTHRVRFRALHLLISKDATSGADNTELSSEEIRVLLRLAEQALEHTNVVQVSAPAIRRGFERLLAREDTRELLDSLLMHIGTAYETEVWGQVRKFIVLDVINDLLALTVRNSLLHLMSAE
jgi:hypothetical protein